MHCGILSNHPEDTHVQARYVQLSEILETITVTARIGTV